MEKTPIGKIRKLIVGEDPLKAFSYEVGQKFGSPKGVIEITEIEEDQSSYYFFGSIRYIVYAKKEGGQPSVWKMMEKMPVTVECYI